MLEEDRRLRGELRRGFGGGLGLQAALFVGFGLIFGLWLVSAYDSVRRISEVEARASAIAGRFMQAEQLLSTVNAQLLLGSIYLRDALLDRSDTAEDYRARLYEARRRIDEALVGYVPVMDSPAERDTLTRLHSEIGRFWNTVLQVLVWDAPRRGREIRRVLRREVIPQREAIMSISDRIRDLNRSTFQQQRAELSELRGALQRRVWQTSGLALLLSLGIAFVVTRHATRLEIRIREQIVKDFENSRRLQRLSAMLVRAQEEERRTIARELHDEIGQALTAIKLELGLAQRRLEAARLPGSWLDDARGIADRTLQNVRDLSQLLRPPILDDLGLPAAVEWHLRVFSKRTGIRSEFIHERMQDRLAPELETCVYRIVQEALTNIARHAEASACCVYLRRTSATLLLTVEDDGKGIPTEPPGADQVAPGLGLIGVQERVADLEGSFRLEHCVPTGTRLVIELPALPQTAVAVASGEGIASVAAGGPQHAI